MSFVEIEGLRVQAESDAGNRIEIIKDVSFTVAKGEMVALIGESGSGKTTIALALMGYTRRGCRITGGAVRLDGRDLVTMNEAEHARLRGTEVAYVPQSAAAAFNPTRRLIDQVTEVAAIHKLMARAEARSRAVALFRALALPDPERIGERYPHQVSGGQLQRLAAAMALIGDPKLLIFDEPTTGLDVMTARAIVQFIRECKERGKTVIFSTHVMTEVEKLCDRVGIIHGGKLLAEGTIGELNAKTGMTDLEDSFVYVVTQAGGRVA